MSDDRGDPSTGLDCAGALFVETGHPILGRVLRASACIVPGTLLVRERPVMAMTPLRELDAPERKALLAAVAELGASTFDLFCAAHAFALSPQNARFLVLSTFCGVEAVDVEVAEARQALREVEIVAAWCAEHMAACASVEPADLRQALMCFHLNAHHTPRLGDRRCGALYAIGSRFTHACLSANCAFEHDDDCLVHRAVCTIEPGAVLTSNYLGPWEYGSTRVRRAALVRSKCFVCGCASCERSIDPMRALPCPNCGPQRANSGLLGEVSDDELAGSKTGSMLPTRLDDGGGEEWRCATCKHVLSEQAMDREVSVPGDWPLVSSADAYGSSLLGWERRIESAAHNLLLHVYAGASGGAVNATLPRMPAILGAVYLTNKKHYYAFIINICFLFTIVVNATLPRMPAILGAAQCLCPPSPESASGDTI